ncbi:MAG TPA: DUF1326 domain-containing protein, partial [Candidatus Dormibacteraeota bacterium]|nr:DUF1326 domain-containing protein [Candidatus Dormibacteraeota bacterium]
AMKRLALGIAAVVFSTAIVSAGAPASGGVAPSWNMNATIIEACSCPMFCQCYFNTSPSGEHGSHGEGGHYCRFNNAFKVNRGSFGSVKLDNAKFWVSGDLGGDFSQGMMDWAIVTFDRATSKEQRDAIATILGSVYPVKWNSLTTAEGDMTWTAGKDEARALLDGGKTAEVALKRFAGMTDEPVVIKNLKYWGVPRNDGFVMMPNTVEAYRVGNKPFEYKGTNGFMITIDTASKDTAPAAKKTGK